MMIARALFFSIFAIEFLKGKPLDISISIYVRKNMRNNVLIRVG